MTNIFPGVSVTKGHVGGAAAAASRAVDLAWRAHKQGTFGVGGFLMTQNGEILAEARNNVIVDGKVDDPTAHVERQLVDWFLDARRQGFAMAPEQLILVSSLDPCAMCAAAILSVGFRAVAVAEDPLSGVHKCGRLHYVPASLRRRAENSLTLFASPARDADASGTSTTFPGDVVPATLVQDAEAAFSQSLADVRSLIAASSPVERETAHIRQLQNDPAVLAHLPANATFVPRIVTRDGTTDRSVLMSASGAVLLECTAATSDPSRNSIVELIRTYARLRRFVEEGYAVHLPHQRRCSIVSAGKQHDDVTAMLSLGALGSSLEDRPMLESVPALGLCDVKQTSLFQAVLAAMPPLYNDVLAISIGTVDLTKAIGRHQSEFI